ncbi:4Fe-4S binding domain-containing protein [Desulfopila aestuarii DSM 18488]|uniref:4Fe-4S binding domain-containing protein n=2 Tax=Desulfopila aestuarii TaxID=231440 RepID=A0A1M7Y601_9BACT|nr:4Fe-4S binding domain-containing protein [Desulfopila aestuarii DSM 18488]
MTPLVPLVIFGGIAFPYFGYVAIAMMVVMVAVSLFRGRFYCGWICAMGAFHERILSRFSMKKPILPFFKAGWLRWLLFMIMMGILGIRLVQAGDDPARIGAAFVLMWTISTVLAIAIGLIWMPRSWCTICPMATFQGIIFPTKYLLEVSPDCKGCGICQKSCPIETDPAMFKVKGVVTSGKCMRCGNCVENCPKGALRFSKTPREDDQCSAI